MREILESPSHRKIRPTLLKLSIVLQDNSLNTDNVEQTADQIYPVELQINKANSSDTEVPFFYLSSFSTSHVLFVTISTNWSFIKYFKL